VKDEYREVARRLRTPRWKSNVERVEKLFGDLSPGELEQEVCSRKKPLDLSLGHLAASSDRLLPLLGIGERLHPEFDAMFISNPDSPFH